MKLQDKVAIITGGANGIGERASKLLAQEGARIMIADYDIAKADIVADEIRKSGGEVITMRIDHTKEEECIEMVDIALEKFGQIDILANIAGVWPRKDGFGANEGQYQRKADPEVRGGFATSKKDDWDKVMDINLNGPRHCTRAVINHMIERRTGKIICFSSIAALRGLMGGIEYATAKSAILGFILTLALEVEQYGIQVNCITPAGTLSERMLEGIERARQAGHDIDLNRYCTPEEVAEAVLFLSSAASNHTSGQNIVIGTPTTP
ncbi:MAG: SDR family oxidoreductase [Dehalococcoidales bacterium]|nr:SDR family oxidoreductase [Dehalococcoidales bacterium]